MYLHSGIPPHQLSALHKAAVYRKQSKKFQPSCIVCPAHNVFIINFRLSPVNSKFRINLYKNLHNSHDYSPIMMDSIPEKAYNEFDYLF